MICDDAELSNVGKGEDEHVDARSDPKVEKHESHIAVGRLSSADIDKVLQEDGKIWIPPRI